VEALHQGEGRETRCVDRHRHEAIDGSITVAFPPGLPDFLRQRVLRSDGRSPTRAPGASYPVAPSVNPQQPLASLGKQLPTQWSTTATSYDDAEDALRTPRQAQSGVEPTHTCGPQVTPAGGKAISDISSKQERDYRDHEMSRAVNLIVAQMAGTFVAWLARPEDVALGQKILEGMILQIALAKGGPGCHGRPNGRSRNPRKGFLRRVATKSLTKERVPFASCYGRTSLSPPRQKRRSDFPDRRRDQQKPYFRQK
jgi:hypothetical protein